MTTGPGTTTAGGSVALSNSSFKDTKIGDLTALTYSTLLGDENPNSVVAPVLRLAVDTKVDNGSGGTISTSLVFEPYYSTTVSGGAQHAIARGLPWQGWDALAGIWWSSAAVNGVCATTCYVTWPAIKAAMPNAVINGAVSFNAGESSPSGPWNNFRGLVDNVNIGVGTAATTFDFEPLSLVTRFSSLNGWGAETQGAPGITFGDGPATPPLGNGSIQWAGVSATSRADMINKGWNGSKLTDLTALSYNTYISHAAQNPNIAPYLQLDCQGCGTGGVNGHLVFEPIYQSQRNANLPAVALNTWQHWDAGTGVWWLSQSGQDPNVLQRLDQWAAANPFATITGVRVGADGRAPWGGFAGGVDSLNIRIQGAEATYDFDPEKPTITSFAPTSGPAGTSVTITGTHFAGTSSVKFNDIGVTPTSVSPTQVVATVPVGATTGVITVISGAGSIISASNFVTGNDGLVKYEESNPAFDFTQSTGWTALNDANESAGRALINPNIGSKVDIGFTGSTIHWVGLRGPNTARANISIDGGPASSVDTYAPVYEPQQVLFAQDGLTPGVHTLHLTYAGKNAAAASTSYMVVDAIETQQFAPSISGFSPGSGAPGTTVQISGAHLDGASAVAFNGTAASFAVNSPSSVTATVPSGATTGPISITVGTQTATSVGSFVVETAPAVTLVRHEAESDSIFNFGSSSGWFRWNDATAGGGESGGAAMLNSASGSFVDVAFAGSVVNWIGLKGPNTAIGLVSIDGVSYGNIDTYAAAYSAKQVLFSKSDLSSGAHTMRITYVGKNAAAATTSYLVVDAIDTAPVAGSITKFSPVGGPVGTTVTITGTNLASTSAVKFNGVSAAPLTVSATQLTVAVPSGASTGLISVVSAGGATNSLSRFTVGSSVLNRFEETASAFTFGAGQGWFSWSDSTTGGGESGGTAQLNPNAGSFVDVAFTGDTVNVVGLKGPNAAIASFIIDGTSYGTVDTYAPSYTAQQVVFSKTGLVPGSHTIRISYNGKNASAAPTSYLVVDGIEAAGV